MPLPGIGSPTAIMALQRSAGNAATASALRRASAPTLAREGGTKEKKKSKGIGGFLKNIFGRKKKPGLKPAEKQAIEKTADNTKKGVTIGANRKGAVKPGEGGSPDGKQPGGEALKDVVDDTKKQSAEIKQANVGEGGGEEKKATDPKATAPEPEKKEEEAEDDVLDGVGSFFEDLEKLVEEAIEREKQLDEGLYTNAVELAKVIKDNGTGGGIFSSMLPILFQHVAEAWLSNSRRALNLPEDKARRQQLEALLEEHKWLTDAAEAEKSAKDVQPDPKMRAKDLNRYHVAKGTKTWFVKPDGTWGSFPFGQDFAFDELPIETLNGIRGYVFEIDGKKYLLETKNVRHETGGGFEKVSGPLFPPDPEPAHVQQTSLGDCYLQAAVASLADKNPGLIKAMFRDNDKDGTVTVRLYKPDRTDPNKPTFSPQYVTINKSVPKDVEGKAAYNAGASWVRLIEKAYAAGGFTGEYGKAAPATKDYASIEGGFTNHAMEVLTGRPGERVTKFQTGWHGFGDAVPWGAAEHARHTEAQKPGGKYDGTLSFQILGDKADVDKWIAFTKTKDFTDVYDTHLAKLKAGFAHDLTISDLKAGLDKFSDQGIAGKILEYVKKQQLLPGSLGEAVYSKTQLELFRKIEATLLKGGMVHVDSWKYPGEKKSSDPGITTSAGEATYKGMVGGHAFSVLATRAAAPQNPEDKGVGDFYWVKIRNPWGHYGRKYDFTKTAEEQGIAEPKGDGVSWVELSDVTKYFKAVVFG